MQQDHALLLATIIFVIMLIPRYREPVVYPSAVTPEECKYIMNKARDKLKPSTVALSSVEDLKVRQSETAWLDTDDVVINRVCRRLLRECDRPFENCEQLQVVRYEPGGFYRPHQDAFQETRNRRMYTFIIGLNDGYEGGATSFPNLDRSFKLKQGDVLMFDTLDNYGMIPPGALHAGTPVESGEKWIANLWVHTYPYKGDT
ncbi:hypothetical protein DSLPV1_103 [Dishui lake phycodnavirus 1]|uniref:2OG-Fe(II) oxygenase n=1 Tax=Dishui lake phycodnavirus 1 TaxID=2079134 RepID=UPI000CD6A457|nr:2OG-Fe(II) oxygenase [Dishui lake phycodnavirus 1]AUT19074.1 hypothetical protein DSLPV1_103 [Dishui lake phycodnavirus 1]